MKFHLDFVGIIGDSLQIFIKHKKPMALITLFTLLLNSIIILCNFLSIEPLLNDLVMKETLLLTRSPGSSEYASLPLAVAADFKIIAGVQWLFILAICIVSLLTSTLAILASAITYVGLELNFTDLLVKNCEVIEKTIYYLYWKKSMDLRQLGRLDS
ncbi:Dol-P-Glc:Glc(2)Man(9)GlcNAc(2)-PP-Dol alpha-1,2-glucosyltransferase [Quillaja saponaria]|uniref:Dol-P-Glc:Glc(2)Man(9)GlcNAc(2)-PP-Dol alpha-1,2-glucosyltransferase n=1 Tax=Quillaja saponaria TaxID=32244 RepID=A0AAD7LE45_QUISA|nr:Dol-P-Glc:Glc(2)Man(9)GlcNAc(2)-PP-Dol alpha-1,2-glucosyltransferase [Quillaja saponaria]